VRDVLGVFLYADLREVILVGHSYGGMVITAIAEQIPDRLTHLVYLDTQVPHNNDSLASLAAPEAVKGILDRARMYGDGYRRITPPDSDVLIDFDNIYVGEIPDLKVQGLVQGYSLELDNKDRDQSNMLSDLEYYYVDKGSLVQQSAGPLDRDDPDQKQTYDFFFGPNRKIRETPRVESFTIFDLIHRGYVMPDWAKRR
jgi:pimeloyl-ACP methyl ester carboxylesterase